MKTTEHGPVWSFYEGPNEVETRLEVEPVGGRLRDEVALTLRRPATGAAIKTVLPEVVAKAMAEALLAHCRKQEGGA